MGGRFRLGDREFPWRRTRGHPDFGGSGLVQISKAGRQGQQEVLSLIEANDFFGELAILDRGPRSATAMALKHTVIGEIDRSAFDVLMEKAPRVLRVNFPRHERERLRST